MRHGWPADAALSKCMATASSFRPASMSVDREVIRSQPGNGIRGLSARGDCSEAGKVDMIERPRTGMGRKENED